MRTELTLTHGAFMGDDERNFFRPRPLDIVVSRIRENTSDQRSKNGMGFIISPNFEATASKLSLESAQRPYLSAHTKILGFCVKWEAGETETQKTEGATPALPRPRS